MVKMAALGTEPQPGSGVMTTMYMNLGLTDQSEDKVVICNGSLKSTRIFNCAGREQEEGNNQTRSSVYLRETK